jgi:iron(III) transport system substrate-binding protein
MSRFHCFLALFPFWLLSLGCVPRPENEVVIYAAADREFATPILDGFERGKEKISITRQFDIESSKTLGLVLRIEAESAKPSCDCFWNNEIMHTLRLQKKGLLQARRWPIPETWPKSYRASDGSWVGFAARARVILVNKVRLPQETEWPSSVLELANPKWKNRCGMAYPIYGTTATHLAVLSSHADKIPSGINAESDSGKLNFEQWTSTVANNAVVLSGNKQVALAVGRGDLDWCITDTDDAIIEKENGQPVEIVFPDQEVGQFGTLFIPNTLAVLKNSPHPTAADLLADYLISEKVEARLAMGNGAHFPVWPNATQASRVSGEKPIRWSEVDFELASQNWDSLIGTLQSTFGQK